MAVILSRHKLTAMHKPHPLNPSYQTWEWEMILIQSQLTQLRAIFERASFMLSKRDFERLDALDLAQKSLQKKIKLLIQNLRAQQLTLQLTRHKSLENILSEIEQGLARLSSSLADLKNEKFANKIKSTFCL